MKRKKKPPSRKTLCSEIRKGHEEQKDMDAAMEIDALDWDEEKFYDAITGEELNPILVRRARQEEIEYYRLMKVYTKVPRRLAWDRSGKAPIKVRWSTLIKGQPKHLR